MSDQPQPPAPPPPAPAPNGEAGAAPLAVEIQADNMEAFATIPADYEHPIESAVAAVNAQGVVFGIDMEAFKTALTFVGSHRQARRFLVARGASPRDAVDGRIEFKFTLGRNTELAESDATVDHHETGHFVSAKANQVLAEMIPPQDSKFGSTVTGHALLPAKRQAHIPRLVAGKNVRVENNQYIATHDGVISHRGDRLEVLDHVNIPQNVDFSVGNIHHTGAVTVRGSLRPGFMIEAHGSVTVYGEVVDAKIISGDTVTIHQGIVGEGKSEVRAKNHVNAGFVENSLIEAGGDIKIRNHALNSRMAAGGHIRITAGKGAIIGGEARAGKGIEARIIGSESAMKTVVALSGTLEQEQQIKTIQEQLAVLEQQMKKIRISLGEESFKAMLADPALVRKMILATRRPIIQRLVDEYKRMEALATDLRARQAALTDDIQTTLNGRIRASVRCHAGTLVSIGNLNLRVNHQTERTTFYADFQKNVVASTG